MQFGYFTLSDNHYENNQRTANELIADILDEAVYAEEVGLHSAWIGEHHFSTLGVLSCPDLVLAQVAARTSRIRLAPAVTVLPLHHPGIAAIQYTRKRQFVKEIFFLIFPGIALTPLQNRTLTVGSRG